MNREEAHKLVDLLFDHAAAVEEPADAGEDSEAVEGVGVRPATTRLKPAGKRVVRPGGDRVYLLDEEKKTRQWVTNPEVLEGLGFDMSDVVEIDEAELFQYQMGPALYRVEA